MLANSIIDSFVNDISSMYSLVSLVILLVAIKLYLPITKGWLGEAAVKRTLAKLPADHYHVLHDVLLPCSDGETTQIDHVVVGRSAIYVIETKNYNGAVYSQEKEANWTVAYNPWSKYKIQNPFRQNFRHIKAIQDVVGSDIPVQNLVVLVRGFFPKGRPERVLSPGEIARFIHWAEQASQASGGITEHVLRLIQDAMIMGAQARKQHVWRLKLRFGGSMITPTNNKAHALVVLAVIVFVVGAVHSETRRAAASIADMAPHAHHGSGAQYGYANQAAIPQPHRTMARPDSTARIPQPNDIEVGNQHQIDQIEIIGSLNGMASIREGGKIYTLHNGETTPLGWKLVAATTKGVDMIRPDGKPFHMDW